jgi:hypothetical protein
MPFRCCGAKRSAPLDDQASPSLAHAH